ncbi:MAG: aminotransferase class III-fold pyridoxal phosphate-dependent enzyme, partial [Pollutimonas bauzanensis]
MTHVFHRNPRQHLDFAMRGQGIELFDQNGKGYIDASGGAAVSCLGHGHPVVIQAIKDQLDRIAYAHSSFFTTQAAEDLADFLADKNLTTDASIREAMQMIVTALQGQDRIEQRCHNMALAVRQFA